MTIPFLKRKMEPNIAGDEDTASRKPDSAEYDMVDAIAEDMMEAFESKDKDMLKAALESLCDYIREEDEEQDKEMA